MPLAPAELRRGRIVYAVFPFAAEFPLTTDGRAVPSIELYAARHGGRPARIVTAARLRPVLLLHDGTRGEHEDVVCLRVNAVKRRHRRATATWERIGRNEHPFFFHLAQSARYGLPQDSVIALSSIGAIHKSAILGPRHVGELTAAEMQSISERLQRVLSLDLARQIATVARELLRRAGVELPS